MSLVSVADAKAQGRITESVEDVLIQGYLDAAEMHVMQFLNRNVYADATALLAARGAAATAFNGAYSAWGAAQTTYTAALPTPVADQAYEASVADWNAAQQANRMTQYGIPINAAIQQAVVLLVAGWYANREYLLTETGNAIEIPQGFEGLLFPYRVRLGV